MTPGGSLHSCLRSASVQVVICHNHVGSQHEIDVALIHELIHAYDHCRGANLDWSNCEHHACSEVLQTSYTAFVCKVAGSVITTSSGDVTCVERSSDLHQSTAISRLSR